MRNIDVLGIGSPACTSNPFPFFVLKRLNLAFEPGRLELFDLPLSTNESIRCRSGCLIVRFDMLLTNQSQMPGLVNAVLGIKAIRRARKSNLLDPIRPPNRSSNEAPTVVQKLTNRETEPRRAFDGEDIGNAKFIRSFERMRNRKPSEFCFDCGLKRSRIRRDLDSTT